MLSKMLADKELELATLENTLAAFEDRYARRVAVLFAELDGIEREIAQELLRLHPEDLYRRHFHDAARKARASQERVKDRLGQAEKRGFAPPDELKKLFYKVAKAVHPDLATDQEDRAYRTTLMARANAAYERGDQEALEQILAEWERRDRDGAFSGAGPEDSPQMEVRIRQIRARLAEIADRLAELRASDLYQLMVKVHDAERQGHDLLGEMASDLREQIASARQRLYHLRRQAR
jgi:hypothetical protein